MTTRISQLLRRLDLRCPDIDPLQLRPQRWADLRCNVSEGVSLRRFNGLSARFAKVGPERRSLEIPSLGRDSESWVTSSRRSHGEQEISSAGLSDKSLGDVEETGP